MKFLLTIITPLIGSLILNSCSSGPVENIAASTSSTQPVLTAAPSSNIESSTLTAVNRYRASKGLSRLQAHAGLAKLAEKHSEAMARRNDMSHFDFKKRVNSARKNYQMGAVSENLHRTFNFTPAGAAISHAWANSPKHRDNMEGNFSYAGVGVARAGNSVFTTLFLGQDPPPRPKSSRSPLLNF